MVALLFFKSRQKGECVMPLAYRNWYVQQDDIKKVKAEPKKTPAEKKQVK